LFLNIIIQIIKIFFSIFFIINEATVNSKHSLNKNDYFIFFRLIITTVVLDLGTIIIFLSLANFCSVYLTVVLEVEYLLAKLFSFNISFGENLRLKILSEIEM